MLKFFRKIRLNLLSEGNTVKYLKYGIGEILLVVIGILIALSIDDWNQERIDRIQEKYYLQRIIQDLEADMVEMNSVVNRSFGQVSTAVAILDYMNVNTEEYIMNLGKGPQMFALGALEEFPNDAEKLIALGKKFSIKHYGLWAGQEFDLTISTFNEMLNNGKLEVIIDLELRKNIINHYNKALNFIDIQKHMAESRQDHRTFLLSQNIPANHGKSIDVFIISLKDKEGYKTILKNYIWGVSFGSMSYRGTSFQKKKELIKAIESYLDEL